MSKILVKERIYEGEKYLLVKGIYDKYNISKINLYRGVKSELFKAIKVNNILYINELDVIDEKYIKKINF